MPGVKRRVTRMLDDDEEVRHVTRRTRKRDDDVNAFHVHVDIQAVDSECGSSPPKRW